MLLAAEAILVGLPSVAGAPVLEERGRRGKQNRKKPTTTTTSAIVPVPTPIKAQAQQKLWWVPDQTTTWQVQLSGIIKTDVNVQAIEIDADTPIATVTKLKASGKKVVAYISGGSYEDWRNDEASFPDSVLGTDLDGWPGERWLDTSNLNALRPIMQKRAVAAKAKGFDAIDWDNMDGYTQKSGFKITYAHQIAYNKMLAQITHDLGMSVALKNDLDQVKDLEPFFDFAVNESCSYYKECKMLEPFFAANKAVVGLEYPGFNSDKRSINQVKDQTDQRSYTLIKNLSLDAYGIIVRSMTNV